MAHTRTPFGSTPAVRVLILLVLIVAGACSTQADPPAGTMDRETFIATYVDLRATVIRTEGYELSDADRTAVLARHGVTEEALLAFAEVHGDDVAFMREVWDEVESRLDAERVLPPAEETP